jgi:hypothetical protein
MKFDWKVVVGSLIWSVSVYPGLLLVEACGTGSINMKLEWFLIIGTASVFGVTLFALATLILSLRDKKKPKIIYIQMPRDAKPPSLP